MIDALSTVGWVIVTVAVPTQPLASNTVTEYVAAHSTVTLVVVAELLHV